MFLLIALAAGLLLGWILGWLHGRAVYEDEQTTPDVNWRVERLRRIMGEDPVIGAPRITTPLDELPGLRSSRIPQHAARYDEVDHRHV